MPSPNNKTKKVKKPSAAEKYAEAKAKKNAEKSAKANNSKKNTRTANEKRANTAARFKNEAKKKKAFLKAYNARGMSVSEAMREGFAKRLEAEENAARR